MSKLTLSVPVFICILLAIAIEAWAVKVQWQVPQQRADGTPMVVGIGEYFVCLSDVAIPDDKAGADCSLMIPSPEPFPAAGTIVTTEPLTCAHDPCHVRVGVLDLAGHESALSNALMFTTIPLETLTISIVIGP